MRKHFLELIRLAATTLPSDVVSQLEKAAKREVKGSASQSALTDIVENCRLAQLSSRPLCQDTGTNIWYVNYPVGMSQAKIRRDIIAATKEATKKAYLRPNSVDPITGKNSGDNTGEGMPVIHLNEWNRKTLTADLLLKGGGSENVSALYSLPDASIGAGRDLEGIRRVVVDAVFNAQGKGCGPGIVGAAVGGDRATCMTAAKEQLFRSLDDTNTNPILAKLEKRLLKECNSLGIGPMGFGGKTTLLAVKIGTRHRLPASYFVAVAYLCWASRKAGVTISEKGAKYSQETRLGKEVN